MKDSVLVWISVWTTVYKIMVKCGLSPWRSYVWTSLFHAILVSVLTLPYAVPISCFASAETIIFSPPPFPWILDASLGYYTFDTIRSANLLMRACSYRPAANPLGPLSMVSRSTLLSETSPLLIPTTFPFSLTLSVSLSMTIVSNLYRSAAFALLAEELSTVFLRIVQLTPSKHPIQLCATLLFATFFVVMRVVVGTVLIFRSGEFMDFFSWASVGERMVQLYLAFMLIVSRVVHMMWVMALGLAVTF